jgi:hypothetical protein
MAKFRKKPVVVEAEQWFPGKDIEGVHEPIDAEVPMHFVKTAHNQIVYLQSGDWVIREPEGRGYYPCKPDIFEATYDPVIENLEVTEG